MDCFHNSLVQCLRPVPGCLLGIFQRTKPIVMQISFVMLIFIALDPNFTEGGSASRDASLLPEAEGQCSHDNNTQCFRLYPGKSKSSLVQISPCWNVYMGNILKKTIL